MRQGICENSHFFYVGWICEEIPTLGLSRSNTIKGSRNISPSQDPAACLQGLALRVVLGWLWCTPGVPDSFPDLQEARTLRNWMEAVLSQAGSILKSPKMSSSLHNPKREVRRCAYHLWSHRNAVCIS